MDVILDPGTKPHKFAREKGARTRPPRRIRWSVRPMPNLVSVIEWSMNRPLLDVPSAEFSGWVAERGSPRFHADQVVRWVFDRRAESFDAMSDVPRALREALQAEWTVFTTRHAHHHVSPEG